MCFEIQSNTGVFFSKLKSIVLSAKIVPQGTQGTNIFLIVDIASTPITAKTKYIAIA